MKTSLDPGEYDLVHGVFKSLAQAPWFDRTSPNESECAKLVLRAYAGGIVDGEALLASCLPEARRRFSRTEEIAADKVP